jgi:hypothetical protein
MTCKGYDPKAVKLTKEVKRRASTIADRHVRGAFVRSFVEVLQSESRQRTSRNQSK